MTRLTLADLKFACPKCRGPVRTTPAAYVCDACPREYPLRFGIPDFRLRSDRYLDLEAETAKAARLAEAAATRSFEQLLDFYYEITDDVPAELAQRYKASVLGGVETAALLAAEVERAKAASTPGAPLLDAGCGAGSMLVAAAERGLAVAGADIALRWLVICRKRLEEQGLAIPLVCADLADPPFAPDSFSAITAVDLVEHVPDIGALLEALARIARPGAPVWLTAANGRTLGPHPATRLWAIGWLPPRMRSWVARKVRGVDSLRYLNLVSVAQMRRIAERAGFRVADCRPRSIAEPHPGHSSGERRMMRAYRTLATMRWSRHVLLLVGPAFEMCLLRTEPGKRAQ